jgi:transketolase
MIAATKNADAARRRAIDMIFAAQASHLGTSMSLIEMLTAVYESIDVERIKRQDDARDRVIVSKGHGAAATYAVMAQFGLLDEATTATYHTNGTKLAGHVSHAVEAVEHSTGALGHGLPVATGVAIGLRSRKFTGSRAFVILGDGELQEGSNWEALMLASHLKLSNLVVMVDNNRISSITTTSDVINMLPLTERFAGFGFATYDVDGHDVAAIKAAIASIAAGNRAGVIVCNTVKGNGVPFAENEPIWHYRSLNKELYQPAIDALPGRE